MDKILSIMKSFKKVIIALIVLVVALLVVTKVLPAALHVSADSSPVVQIQAENDTVYNAGQKIEKEDFTVEATHENGRVSTLSSEDFKLSTTKLSPIGDKTSVTVSLADDPDITCKASVKINREKVVGFQCGYPDVSNVVAVLYSNGELCFEGEGDVLVFEQGAFPWMDYEGMDDHPVRSVSFGENVTPSNMNYWFENMESLTYVDTLPESVKTMVSTFAGCTGLEAMTDWSGCGNLINVNYAYSGCSALSQTVPFTQPIRTAKGTFTDCISLKSTPDLSGAGSLANMEEMFLGCSRLSKVSMPPKVVILAGTFAGCINLKEMPAIPTTVTDMNSTFAGDVSMETLTSIPSFVNDTSSTFSGCEMISGDLEINASPEDYSGMFSDAVSATKVNLKGNSAILNEMALTNDGGNVLVNGEAPVEQ